MYKGNEDVSVAFSRGNTQVSLQVMRPFSMQNGTLMKAECKVYFASQLQDMSWFFPAFSTAQLDEPVSKDAIFQHEHKTQPTW